MTISFQSSLTTNLKSESQIEQTILLYAVPLRVRGVNDSGPDLSHGLSVSDFVGIEGGNVP